MFENLVEYASKSSPEEIAHIEIEEMAIIAAWYHSYEGNSERQERYPDSPGVMEYWIENVKKDEWISEGRRLQPLLRHMLDQVVLYGTEHVHRSELDILVEAYDLLCEVADKDIFARLAIFFEPKIDSIKAQRNLLPVTPGLVGVGRRLTIITPEDIAAARPRSVRSFAGVRMSLRGPVYQGSGDVKVMGMVPDDCMLVVDEGTCLVNGYVLGYVAASHGCEVRDNIAGVVIVRDGDSRGRNVLTNAFVVSKWGSIHVRKSENPKLLFGGKEIQIRESAQHGSYASPEIQVAEETTGGEYSVSTQLTADKFQATATRKLIIALRRNISCEDYGGLVDPEATRLLSLIAKVRRRRDNTRDMIALAEIEVEHFASSALISLAGGEDIMKQIEEVNHSQSRIALLDRLIASVDTMSVTVEEQLDALHDPDRAAAIQATKKQSIANIQDLQAELRRTGEEEGADADLMEEGADLARIAEELSSQNSDTPVPAKTLFLLWEKKAGWLLERQELSVNKTRKASEIVKLLGDNEILGARGEELSDMKLLSRLLEVAYKRQAGDRLFDRANTSFVQLMLRSIESRKLRVREYTKTLEILEKELKMEYTHLERECRMPPPPELNQKPSPPTVTGKFCKDVTICIDRFLLDEKERPPRSVLQTEASGNATVRYARENDMIVKVENTD
ncbi:MAG: hypothetical protein IIB38_04755 [Candidatus Hydrogenedentes bacterium]|nr:hypothetical protein [Candidatus Hydrogenedentota bacterium]